MPDAPIEFPDTPAGAHAAWVAEQLAGGAASLTPATCGERIAIPGATDERMVESLRSLAGTLAGGELLRVDPVTDARVSLVYALGGRSALRITLETEPGPPQRVSFMWMARVPRAGVTVRIADPADDAALRDVEFRTPRAGTTTVAIERLGSFWDGEALMDGAAVLVAEIDGQVAGLFALATRESEVGGERTPLLYLHRARVLPEFQRLGVGSALVDAALTYAADRRIPSMHWYVALENDVAHAFARASHPWAIGPEVAILRCSAVAAAAPWRRATPADAQALADLWNDHHGREALSLPRDRAGVARRLERAPSLYGWGDVALGAGALVGVRADGARTRAWTERDGERRSALRAAVLDHACREGAEDALVALIRARCADLAREGVDELTLITSPGARARDAILAVAAEVVPYDAWVAGIAEPPDLAQRGLYTDPVYF